jgi:hypothetical protein
MITKTKPSYPGLSYQKSEPAKKLSDYSILLYGQEKIGKTTFAAEFPNPYFFMFEPGGKDLSVHKSDIQDWAHFRHLLKQIEADKKFDNVIFDTADVASIMCDRYVCEINGVSDVDEMDFGKGWRKLRLEFSTCVQRLLKSGKGVLFISHSTEKEFKTKTGSKITRVVPTMSKQAREILDPIVDIWAYYRYNGKQREIVLRGDEEVSAGHRTRNHFLGVTTIPAGTNEGEAYQNFVAAFENRLSSPATKLTQQKFKWKNK